MTNKLQNAINILQSNDQNGTWYEVETIEEMKESLIEAMTNYEETEETYIFYMEVYNSL